MVQYVYMSFRNTFSWLSIVALIIIGLLPVGLNKFDIPKQAMLLYAAGPALLIALILIGKKFWQPMESDEFRPKIEITIIIAALAFAALNVVSFVVSPIKNFGFSEVAMNLIGVGIFFLVRVMDARANRAMINTLLLAALATTFVGLYWYLTHGETRIAGTFFDIAIKSSFWPNAYALFILMTWPLALTREDDNEKIILLALLFTGLILSFSRGAIITAVGQIVLLLIAHKNYKNICSMRRIKQIATIGILVIALTTGINQIRAQYRHSPTLSFIDKAQFAGTERETSVVERKEFITRGLKLSLQKPWFGMGPGSFRFVYPRYAQTELLATSDHPHNWYIKIALEQGYPTLIAFLIFLMGAVCVSAWRQHRAHGNNGNVENTAMFIAVAGALAHQMIDYNLNFIATASLFWLLLGGLARPNLARAEIAAITQSHRRTSILRATIATAIILITSVALIREGYYSYKRADDKLLFPRTIFLDRATSELTDATIPQSIALAERHIALNPYDARGYHTAAKLYERIKNFDKAYDLHTHALQADPMNNFIYYLNYFRFAQLVQKTDNPTYRNAAARAITLLTSYPALVQKNIHYTAQTSNLRDSIQLAKLLKRTDLAEKIQAAYRTFQNAKK